MPLDNDLKITCNNILKVCSETIDNSAQKSINEILAISFAYKIRNSVSSVIKLLDYGFVHDSYILSRSIAEATICCCESLRNVSFLNDFHNEEIKRSKLLTGKIVNFETLIQGTPAPEMIKQRDYLKQAYLEHKGDEINLEKLAKLNDCILEYYYIYALGSAYVHNLPNVMSSYGERDDEKMKFTFIPMPDIDDFLDVLHSCVYCLIKVSININQHFQCGRELELMERQNEFIKIIIDRLTLIESQKGLLEAIKTYYAK